MLPLSPTTTSAGELNWFRPPPTFPGVPSRISSSPVGLNLMTWCPRVPSGVRCSETASAIQTLPSGSTSMPCGQITVPLPKLSTAFPFMSNFTTGSRSESRHSVPNRSTVVASQRITAHRCLPSGSIFRSPTAPIVRSAGSLAHGSAGPRPPALKVLPIRIRKHLAGDDAG